MKQRAILFFGCCFCASYGMKNEIPVLKFSEIKTTQEPKIVFEANDGKKSWKLISSSLPKIVELFKKDVLLHVSVGEVAVDSEFYSKITPLEPDPTPNYLEIIIWLRGCIGHVFYDITKPSSIQHISMEYLKEDLRETQDMTKKDLKGLKNLRKPCENESKEIANLVLKEFLQQRETLKKEAQKTHRELQEKTIKLQKDEIKRIRTERRREETEKMERSHNLLYKIEEMFKQEEEEEEQEPEETLEKQVPTKK